MRIAVYIENYDLGTGGAQTLTETIKQEILESKTKDEYVFCWCGKKFEQRKIKEDGFVFFNLSHFDRKKVSKFNIPMRFVRKIKRNLGKLDERFLFDRFAEEENIDIFWFTAPIYSDISYPYIYTVWDLGHRTTPFFPEVSRTGWTWEERENTYQRMLCKASYILTGNQEGKKEILTNYAIPENKIRISPFPVAALCRGKEIKPNFDIPEKYFFYPAQFWPHKNHICILEALKVLKEKYSLTPTVFFTGSDKGNKEYILNRIKEYNLDTQVKITGFLKDEELKYLYTHATAMIFASLMGPNNMPPIEATYLNCPVIITDLDGHKEQLGDTALYFNGYNPSELANYILKLLNDKSLRDTLIIKEKELAKEFASINYFAEVKNIISEYSKIRNTWGNSYICK